jgi:hypothetical protein
LVGPGLSALDVLARVGVIGLCLAPAAAIALSGHAGGIGVAIFPFLFKPLRDWLRPLFDEPTVPGPRGVTESCPGIEAYRLLLDCLIDFMNGHTDATSSDGAESGRFGATFSDLEITLGQMRRVIPPPVAQSLHKKVIHLSETYLGISRDWIAGKDVRSAIAETETREKTVNESIAALRARCP